MDWSKALKEIPGYDPYGSAGDCVFDAGKADTAIEFFETCITHVKGELAGSPFILALWQKAIIGNLFGWMRPDGTRRYREAFIYVPRKNGKTTLAAGISPFGLCSPTMSRVLRYIRRRVKKNRRH